MSFENFNSWFSERAQMTIATLAVARIQKSYYDSLIDAGFTESQATHIHELALTQLIKTLPDIAEATAKVYKIMEDEDDG